MARLEGKVVAVTGAANGIGAARVVGGGSTAGGGSLERPTAMPAGFSGPSFAG